MSSSPSGFGRSIACARPRHRARGDVSNISTMAKSMADARSTGSETIAKDGKGLNPPKLSADGVPK